MQLHDRPGALYRAVGLIRRRDYNVSSLVVGASERPGTSRMVLVVEAVDVHQVLQQLSRLVDVLSVAEIGRTGDALVRETALAVVEVADDDRTAIEAAANESGCANYRPCALEGVARDHRRSVDAWTHSSKRCANSTSSSSPVPVRS